MSLENKYLNITQAAEFLCVKKTTLYWWVHQRKVPYRKHGSRLAFAQAELHAWSERRAVPQLEPGFRIHSTDATKKDTH